jgi:hypothetical protein
MVSPPVPPSVPGDSPESAKERRRARRDDPLVALSRWFEAARRRAGLHALVLADETGLTIAGAGPSATCDELAAHGALATTRKPANDTVPCRLDVVARTMQVRRLRIDGIDVLLCAEGARPSADEHLAAAAAGCERILARRKRPTPDT